VQTLQEYKYAEREATIPVGQKKNKKKREITVTHLIRRRCEMGASPFLNPMKWERHTDSGGSPGNSIRDQRNERVLHFCHSDTNPQHLDGKI